MISQANKKQRSTTYSVPSPIAGWNTKDALADMEPTYAVVLENWWCTSTDLQIRRGYTNFVTGLVGNVETLMSYNAVNGTRKLFAVTSSGNLYDVTTQGAVGVALVTGLANGRWQYIAFATPGGNFLLACNGADSMLRYDGTNWVSITAITGAVISSLTGNGTTSTVTTLTPHLMRTGNTITVTGASVAGFNVAAVSITVTGANTFTYLSTGTPSATGASYVSGEGISGINTQNISNINNFKTRIWFTKANSLSAFYLPSLAIAGAATEFPMGSVFSMGGYLQTMATWTIDAGSGSDDNAVFLSSEGEVLVYKGTDPASSTTFALVGLYRQADPIGNRSIIKYGGDLMAITDQGVFALSRSILTAQVTEVDALTDKIRPTMAAAVNANRGFGWELCIYSPLNMLLINVPNTVGGNYQFAMNLITKAFTKFTGWNASCFCSSGSSLYFGSGTNVCIAWTVDTDNTIPITAKALPAFSNFGTESINKKLNLVRPILTSAGMPQFLIGINYDYDTITVPTGLLNYSSPSAGMVWGSMTWGTMKWGGLLASLKAWQWAGGIGYVASMGIIATNNGSETHWSAVDYVYETGGIL